MLKGISIMAEEGKFSQAAKYEEEIAGMFETVGDLDNSMKHFEVAGEYYDMEGSKATAARCLDKMVPLAAAKGDYHKAIELIEKICDAYVNSLARHSIKDHCLRGGILYLCIPDYIAATKGLERWCGKYNDNFRGTREHNFLTQLVAACSSGNSSKFRKAVGEWEGITPLDSFKENYLQKAAERLEGGEDEGDDDFT